MMANMNRHYFKFLIFILLPGSLYAQPPGSAIDQFKSPIDSIVKPVVDGGFSPGIVVGVIYQGQTRVWGYGSISTQNTNSPNGDTEFEIASITKLFTNLLFSDMVHQHRVGLNDLAQDYLPTGVTMPQKDGKQITLLMLANHTSGLPCFPDDMGFHPSDDPESDSYSPDMLYHYLSRYQLTRTPGQGFLYSCMAPALLGNLLALKKGTTWIQYLRERILDPLGMNDTGVAWTPEELGRVAEGFNGETQPPPLWKNKQSTFLPEGALHSTVNDLLKLARAALDENNQVLSGIAFDEIAQKLGWGTEVAHQGWSGDGFNSFFWMDRKNKMVVIVWGRCDAGFPCQVGDRVQAILMGKPPVSITLPTLTSLSEDQLKTYPGSYRVIQPPEGVQAKDGLDIKILPMKDCLVAQGPAWWSKHVILFPETKGRFFIKKDASTLAFNLDPQGKVVGFTVTSDQSFDAERVGYKGPGIKDDIPPPP